MFPMMSRSRMLEDVSRMSPDSIPSSWQACPSHPSGIGQSGHPPPHFSSAVGLALYAPYVLRCRTGPRWYKQAKQASQTPEAVLVFRNISPIHVSLSHPHPSTFPFNYVSTSERFHPSLDAFRPNTSALVLVVTPRTPACVTRPRPLATRITAHILQRPGEGVASW